MNPRRRFLHADHLSRRVVLWLLVVVAALAVTSLVLLSPLALAALNPDGSADWERLADIAQTYAAASAILALLALGGVVVSLVLQARELRLSRSQALRFHHFEMLKMAMEDPVYLSAWGPTQPVDEQGRQDMYVNAILAYWYMAYELGDLSELHLRVVAANLFAGEAGQRFWAAWRDTRRETSTDKQTRRFHEIVDEEYQKATQPPPAPEPAPAPSEPGPEPEAPESSDQEESEQESPEQPR